MKRRRRNPIIKDKRPKKNGKRKSKGQEKINEGNNWFSLRFFKDRDMLPASSKNVNPVRQVFKEKKNLEENAIVDGLFAFAHEYISGGAKSYASMNLNAFLHEMRTLQEDNMRFHETIFDNRFVKLKLDIETGKENNEDFDFVSSIDYLIEHLVEFFKENKIKCEKSWFVIENATREKKYSVHVTMYKGICFENVDTLVKFIHKFQYWLIQREVTKLESTIDETCYESTEDCKMVSILSRSSSHYEEPSSVPPFCSNDDDSTVDVGNERYKLISIFKSIIDLEPLTHKNGTLRCYYSTIASEIKNPDARLHISKIIEIPVMSDENPCKFDEVEKHFDRLRKMDEKMIPHCLAQCIFPEVDGIRTKIISLNKSRDLNEYDKYRKNINEKITYYTFLMHRLYNVPIGKGMVKNRDSFISFDRLKDLHNDDQNEIFSFIHSFVSGSRRINGNDNRGNTSQDIEKYRCKIVIYEHDNQELYECVRKLLKNYGVCPHIQGVFKEAQDPKLKILKINENCSAIMIGVKNTICEIIQVNEKRRHQKHTSGHYNPSVFFKLLLDSGTCFQKCFKTKCKQKRGHQFYIGSNLFGRITSLTVENEVFMEWFKKQT